MGHQKLIHYLSHQQPLCYPKFHLLNRDIPTTKSFQLHFHPLILSNLKTRAMKIELYIPFLQ